MIANIIISIQETSTTYHIHRKKIKNYVNAKYMKRKESTESTTWQLETCESSSQTNCLFCHAIFQHLTYCTIHNLLGDWAWGLTLLGRGPVHNGNHLQLSIIYHSSTGTQESKVSKEANRGLHSWYLSLVSSTGTHS